MEAYVGPSEGEHVLMRGGRLFFKTGPMGVFGRIAMGTQQVLTGVGIPVHRHFDMDETFHIIDGRGTSIMDDVRYPIEKGGSIFIPRNSWHGFDNPDCELFLLWIIAPPGVENFFREVGVSPGAPTLHRANDDVNRIARKYGTEFK